MARNILSHFQVQDSRFCSNRQPFIAIHCIARQTEVSGQQAGTLNQATNRSGFNQARTLCIVVIRYTYQENAKKEKCFYARQSPTAPLNTMGITMAQSEKVENSCFQQKYSFIQSHISHVYREGINNLILFFLNVFHIDQYFFFLIRISK